MRHIIGANQYTPDHAANMVLLQLFLILVPVIAWLWAKRRMPTRRWTITGIAFGSIVSPFCVGLYATYFTFPLGLVTGLIGLAGGLVHGAPGYEIATAIGIVVPGTALSGVDHLWVSIVNGFIWGLIYGGAGWFIDRLVLQRSAPRPNTSPHDRNGVDPC